MAYLAMRGSGAVNGVSQLHGEVSRNIFQPLYPRWPQAEVPVGSITNGVHTPSWDSAEADALWTQTCGQNRWMGGLEGIEPTMRQVSEDRLWKFRRSARTTMIEYARERLATQLAASGAASDAVDAARRLFDPDTLTLGFARRFATYKRPNLLLHDPERLARLLNNTARPVQLILAGKAHPADVPGQALIRDWVNFIRRSDIRPHAMFLSDYDMSLTEQLVQGVDVWINTPRRPWEACGTSGMKVLVNGGLNLSELDGWWAEAYASNFGWALGDGLEHGADPGWDAAEAAQLYELLENHVVPEFYARDPAGLPRAWLRRVRESMSGLTPMYSANRAVRDYLHRCYLPGAQAYRQRAERHGVMGAHIASWRRALEHAWPTLSIGAVQVTRLERSYRFSVQVHMGALDPGMLQVQLYAETLESQDAVRAPMSRNELHTSDSGMAVYQVELPATRPVGDYTVRIIPKFDGVQVPLEAPFVLWQK